MNTDISGTVEHLQDDEKWALKYVLIIIVVVVGLFVAIYYGGKIKLKYFSNTIQTNNNFSDEDDTNEILAQYNKEIYEIDKSYGLTKPSQLGGKKLLKKNKNKNKKNKEIDNNQWTNIFMGVGIVILGYMLYRLYRELTTLKKLQKMELDRVEKDNRDTIKIATPSLVGSINAGQYITNRYGYYGNNP